MRCVCVCVCVYLSMHIYLNFISDSLVCVLRDCVEERRYAWNQAETCLTYQTEPATRQTRADREASCATRTRTRLHSAKLISIEWLIPMPIQRIIWIINVRNSFAWKTQNAKWKMNKKMRRKINRKLLSCLGFKSANPKSHCTHSHTHTHMAEWLRGWDFYNQIRTECSFRGPSP